MPKKQKQQKPGKGSSKGSSKDARPAKAGSAPAAAGSSKVVQLSLANEARVRELLQELSQEEQLTSSRGTTQHLDGQQLQQVYLEVYEQLLKYEFTTEQVQAALSALPQHAVSTESALDWLCMHVAPDQLPRRFVGQARASAAAAVAAGGITVKVRGAAGPSAAAADTSYQPTLTSSSEDEQEAGSDAEQSAEEAPSNLTAAALQQQQQKEEEERQALKNRILQQYAGSSSDEEHSEAASEDSVIEDWELWGDPREIERRRAERAFRMQSPEQQRLALAREWVAAREWASAAKATGDKAAQKSAGMLIGKLNSEMAQLGLSPADAQQLVAAAGTGDAPVATEGRQQKKGVAKGGGKVAAAAADADTLQQQQQQQIEGDARTAAVGAAAGDSTGQPQEEDWEGQALFDEPTSGGAPVPSASGNQAGGLPSGQQLLAADQAASAADVNGAAAGNGAPAAAESAEWMVDLFDDSATAAATLEAAATTTAPAAPAPAAAKAALPPPPALTPWGAYGAKTKPTKPDKRKVRPSAPAVEEKLPRALLQQYCQSLGWQPPKFERVPGQGYRYRAVVAPTVAAGGKKKGSKGLAVPRTFQLFAAEDNWTSVNDAQQAVATRALFDLLQPAGAAEQQQVVQQLGGSWRGLWEQWAAASGQESWEQQDLQERERCRDAFISDLLAKQAAGSGAAAAGSHPDAADSGSTAAAGAQEWAPDVDPTTAAAAAGEEGGAVVGLTFTSSWTPEGGDDTPGDDGDGLVTTGDLATADEDAEEWQVAAATDEAEQQQEPEVVSAEDAAALAAREAQLAARSQRLKQQLLAWRGSSEGQRWQQQRGQLPMASQRQEVVRALAAADVVVVGGETGSGKTTQVPQFILEDAVLAGQGSTCSIVVTQPRRIAAITVAQRVAAERGEGAPGAPGGAVGYHVRLEAAAGRDTQLLFCTTGILLRRMASDPLLSSLTHVVVDEVHERTTQGDFLLALLKRVLAARNAGGGSRGGTGAGGGKLPPLKVVLMSATLDAGLYSKYFGGVPVISCQGRTFPVATQYLEDVYRMTGYRLAPDAWAALRAGGRGTTAALKAASKGDRGRQNLLRAGWGDDEAGVGALNPHYDPELYQEYPSFVRTNLGRLNENVLDLDLLEELVAHVDETVEEGAILVFLPGMGEISSLLTRLTSSSRYNRGRHWLLPLHSSISPAQQQQAFAVPPPGVRKIVLSTNIAETSVTVEDVVAVIDSGRHKERRYDPHRHMSLLVEDWISRAAALQRRGRAGRVRPGICYCLYTRHRFEQVLRRYQVPEIARVPLEELILQLHLMGLGPAAAFLQTVLEPPPPKAVAASVAALEEIGALQLQPAADGSTGGGGGSSSTQGKLLQGELEEVLTPLGRHLAMLPLDCRLGKLLVLGACLGCLAPALTIAAAFSHKSPFTATLEQQSKLEAVKRALVAPDAAAAAPATSSSQKQGSEGSSVQAKGGTTAPAAAGSGALRLAAGQQSDHLLLVAVFEMWRQARASGGQRAASQVARQYYLSTQVLEALAQLRQQFATMLQDTHLVPLRSSSSSGSGNGSRNSADSWMDDPTQSCNRFASHPEVVKAALVAALAPHIVVQLPGCRRGSRPGWGDSQDQELYLHPSSVLHELEVQVYRHPYVVYLEKTKTTRVFVRECSVVSPLALLLFGGSLSVQHEQGTILLNGWCHIPAPAQTAVLVKKVRDALDALLEQTVAGGGPSKRGSRQPAGNSQQGSQGEGSGDRPGAVTTARVVDMIQQLLLDGEQQQS